MKIWIKPEICNLDISSTKEWGIDEIMSENSCKQTIEDAKNNKGKGCSYTGCKYHSIHNNGVGDGGKCGGAIIIPPTEIGPSIPIS